MTITTSLQTLRIITVRHRQSHLGGQDGYPDVDASLAAYRQADVYDAAGVPATMVAPEMPAGRTGDEVTDLGLINGAIAEVVAAGRRAGDAVCLVGGDCTHLTGVVGGLQDVHGPGTRLGLVFFDAHGDFNTPQTTLTGSLGGMPVAVAAGLAHPRWREGAHIAAPIPTDRLLLVDVRNLDPEEARLIHAAGVTTAPVGPGLRAAIDDLAARCDLLYLHIDSDVLDARYVPNHGTVEPDGPDMAQVLDAVEAVMATGQVAAYAVVSVYTEGPGRERSLVSGVALVRGGLGAWAPHGMAGMGLT